MGQVRACPTGASIVMPVPPLAHQTPGPTYTLDFVPPDDRTIHTPPRIATDRSRPHAPTRSLEWTALGQKASHGRRCPRHAQEARSTNSRLQPQARVCYDLLHSHAQGAVIVMRTEKNCSGRLCWPMLPALWTDTAWPENHYDNSTR
jgi:hypothetical protein